MKVETGLFLYLTPFFLLIGTAYGVLVGWSEWVGILSLFLTGGLSGMVGFYLWFTARRIGERPEDRQDAEINEGSGEQGFFSPWSWWPLVLALGAATGFLGLAVGFWILYIGLALTLIGLIGWVFEYSRGDNAH